MELQQLEPQLESENKQPLNSRFLEVIVNLNPCLAEDETLLLSYYKQVKSTWSSSAIKSLQKSTELKLTNKLNRCRFAIAAAKLQLQILKGVKIHGGLKTDLVMGESNNLLDEDPHEFTSSLISSGGEEKVTSATWKNKSLPFGGVEIDNRGQTADGRRQMFSHSESYSENNFISTEPNSLSISKTLKDKVREKIAKEKPSALCPPPSAFDAFQVEVLDELHIAQEQIKLLESQLKEREEQLQEQEEQLKQSEQFSVLLLTNRLLTPGLPLNGTEESPAMRILGSPKTLTELDCNYRELIKWEHPDVSPFPQAVADKRFEYLKSLYRITRENWDKLKPTAVISKEQLDARMNAPVPFEPDSFWVV